MYVNAWVGGCICVCDQSHTCINFLQFKISVVTAPVIYNIKFAKLHITVFPGLTVEKSPNPKYAL